MSAGDPDSEQELKQSLLDSEDLRLSLQSPAVCHCLGNEGKKSWKTQYDQLPEVIDECFKATRLFHLKKLSIRNIEIMPDGSALLWECLHVHQLTELNLEKCNLKLLCNELQFWTLPNLTSLNLNHTYLPFLPASIGRLQHLKTLSLDHNHLKTLPHTLSFCTNLEELNLQYNRFSVLPGVILQIPSLNNLRRYGNYDLHVGAADLAASARRNRYIAVVQEQVSQLEEEELGEVIPLKLLAVQSIMTHRIDYWKDGSLAPAVCKILDMSQSEYKICDKCWTAMPLREPGYHVRWLVESYLGLRHVPFEHFACRMECALVLEGQFQTVQAKHMERHDEEYRTMLEHYAAMEEHDSHRDGMRVIETWNIDLPHYVTVNDRWGTNWPFRQSARRRKKCAIV